MKSNTGGPAFPTMLPEYGGETDGMTLRDYFAASALKAMDVQISVARPAADHMAKSAYTIADAMLAERAK